MESEPAGQVRSPFTLLLEVVQGEDRPASPRFQGSAVQSALGVHPCNARRGPAVATAAATFVFVMLANVPRQATHVGVCQRHGLKITFMRGPAVLAADVG